MNSSGCMTPETSGSPLVAHATICHFYQSVLHVKRSTLKNLHNFKRCDKSSSPVMPYTLQQKKKKPLMPLRPDKSQSWNTQEVYEK
jgi:hypothetical protein